MRAVGGRGASFPQLQPAGDADDLGVDFPRINASQLCAPQHRAMLAAHLSFGDLIYPILSRTGSAIYVRTNGKPFLDASGIFLGYRGASTDITATIQIRRNKSCEKLRLSLRMSRALRHWEH